jgi:hypothetical protein
MRKAVVAFLLASLLILSVPGLALAKQDSPGKDIQKYVFIHYFAKSQPVKPAKTEASYLLYKRGIKWADDVVVSYNVNSTNAPENAVAEIEAAFEEWDSFIGRDLFADAAGNTGKVGAVYDRENTVSWNSISQTGVIAMCSFWVNVATKTIVEFDIEFNTYYDWAIVTNPDSNEDELMNVRNIATHEIGHTLILLDLYQDGNSEATMYGYSDYNETNKITLEDGDIAGIRALYGS